MEEIDVDATPLLQEDDKRDNQTDKTVAPCIQAPVPQQQPIEETSAFDLPESQPQPHQLPVSQVPV